MRCFTFFLLLVLLAEDAVARTKKTAAAWSTDTREKGIASYYCADAPGLTAAHPSLPWGTRVTVTNTTNQRSVVVTICDRGPFIKGRIIDLSVPAATALDMLVAGVVPVTVQLAPAVCAPPGQFFKNWLSQTVKALFDSQLDWLKLLIKP